MSVDQVVLIDNPTDANPVYLPQQGETVLVASANGLFHADVTFVRPADTTQYTAGDVIGPISGSALMRFALPYDLTSGYIIGANLIDSANAATVLQSELNLWDRFPGNMQADNVAWADEAIAGRRWLDTIPFTGYYVGGATDGSGQTTRYPAKNLNIPFTTGEGAIYGLPVARNAYTPASKEAFTYRLWIQRP